MTARATPARPAKPAKPAKRVEPATRVEPAKPATRERILVATLELIAAEGVDAVTHRAVAALAGVSLGTSTHYFASREELLRQSFLFYLREGEKLMHTLLDEAASQSADPLARVRNMINSIIEREFATGGLVRAEYELLLYACADPDLAAEVRSWEARVVAVVAALLEAAHVERPMMAARTLLNLVRGYELERMLDPTLTLADFEQRIGPLLQALRVSS